MIHVSGHFQPKIWIPDITYLLEALAMLCPAIGPSTGIKFIVRKNTKKSEILRVPECGNITGCTF